jgi:hypothetical protein
MSTIPETPLPAQPGTTIPKTPVDKSNAQQIRSAAFWIIIAVLLILWLIGWRLYGCGPWIHLLPLLAILTAVVELFSRQRNPANINARNDDIPNWDPGHPEASLAEIHIYVISEAARSIQWYWGNKKVKAACSRFIRFIVWSLAAVGGLLPIIGALLEDLNKNLFRLNLTNGLWASLFLGVAAALLGLDKGFGFSSGWARYVLTATNIKKSLEEFRLDWTDLRAKAGNPLTTAEQVSPLIERARAFRSEVEGMVLQETKDWVTEFQSTMAQMEKDVAAQLDALKTKVDKTIQAKDAASQPGTIQLTIDDQKNKAAAGTLQLTVTDSSNKPVSKTPLTQLNWTSPFMPPGQYLLALDLNSVPVAPSALVTVPSGGSATAKITIG